MVVSSQVEAPRTEAAWSFVMDVLRDLTVVIAQDSRDERERVEGYRVLARVLALATELSVDVDPDVPRVFPMTSPWRQVGGPNPDGEYDLCMLTPGRAYRLTGRRGTVSYLGFQVMAGTGLTPRRQATYVSDRDLVLDADGCFELVLAPSDPGADGQWVQIPEDASAIVVRQYVADRASEELAAYDVQPVEAPGPARAVDDEILAEQLTALGWTAMKLMTLHRTVLPGLADTPNVLVTAEPEALGSENTTPDNLYMLGAFDLGDDEALVIDVVPPQTRYWSVALENVWHECLEPTRRTSSLTNARARTRDDGTVRLVVSGRDPGVPNWLDTGGRRRGFVTLRWLDHPAAPSVATKVMAREEVTA